MKVLMMAVMLVSSVMWAVPDAQAGIFWGSTITQLKASNIKAANRDVGDDEVVISLKALRNMVKSQSVESGATMYKFQKLKTGVLNIKMSGDGGSDQYQEAEESPKGIY